jgi:hypothetical protein
MGQTVAFGNRDQRKAERHAIVLPARVRSRSGFLDRVVVTDISEWGCRFESSALTLHKHDLVVIRPEGIEGLCGRVCWTDGHTAGIEFERALYGPVVDHLRQRHCHFLAAAPVGHGAELRLAA